MRVLVTGGKGWIGTHVVEELLRQGHVPYVMDRNQGLDVCDKANVQRLVPQVEHVIHLAGVIGTHELFDNPQEAVEVNVGGAMNVIEACAEHDVGLTKVTMPLVNPSIYAATHACSLHLSEVYRASRGLRVSYVKPFNAFGRNQPYGERHPQKIVPTFARAGWRGTPLPIWGDGSLPVDLVHVHDIARMLVDAIPYEDGEMFEAGTGTPQTVMDVARKVITITGSTAGVRHLPPRAGERRSSTPHDVATGHGWDLLGWKPEFDPSQFRRVVESYR